MHNADRPKILIVNNEPARLSAMHRLLSQWETEDGFQSVLACSGEEALRYVSQQNFAVVLIEMDMPGMDGLAAAEAIHAQPRAATVPIILVTANLPGEMERIGDYRAGAVDYLLSPVIPHVLHNRISVLVDLARKNLMLKQQTAEMMTTNSRLDREIRERELAVQQNLAKDDFLGLLGHELRNPLSAITSATSIIALKNVSAEKAERAKSIIRRQSEHLSRLVDDLLDLSRAMSGRISLTRQPVEISRLIESCVETLHATGRTANTSIKIAAEPAWVDGDVLRVEQIVANLLDNALKRTPGAGRIEIGCHIRGEHVEIVVRDSGLGISADVLPHVFDLFVPGESAIDRSKGGLGIGLALVRQLVELHGGSVHAASAGADAGSVFTVHLPHARLEAAAAPDAPHADAARKCTVLLIEDNDDGRDMMCMMLTSFGNHVLNAENGKEGLRLALSGKPDIALIDIGLPGIDGYEVARRLRADPATRAMRLVALTGYGLAEDQRRALDAGFDMHLVKPVSAERLLQAVTLPRPER